MKTSLKWRSLCSIQKLERFCFKSKLYLKRHSPTILTCIAAAGVIATAVTAVKVTPKALNLLDDAKNERDEELNKFEIIKTAGPLYIPSIVIGVSTIVCIFSANILNKKQNAALISAYSLLNSSYKEYKNKISELYGEDADRTIRNAIVDEKFIAINNGSVNENDEKFIFYEEQHDSFFEMSMADFYHSIYHFNRNFTIRGFALLNELYKFLGIDTLPSGDVLGWSIDEFYDVGLMPWIDFDITKRTLEDGLEYYIISPEFSPSMEAVEEYI